MVSSLEGVCKAGEVGTRRHVVGHSKGVAFTFLRSSLYFCEGGPIN